LVALPGYIASFAILDHNMMSFHPGLVVEAGVRVVVDDDEMLRLAAEILYYSGLVEVDKTLLVEEDNIDYLEVILEHTHYKQVAEIVVVRGRTS